ncbi:MAG: HRDC domain-containing protein, partial [Pseudomonadota bacterium]
LKPATLDDLAQVPGVGAAKLQRYGRAFLAVIRGEDPAEEHPARDRLAATDGAGALFDRLREAQVALQRGADGTGKPLSCTQATLAKIVERRPRSLDALADIPGMGEAKAERFGAAFLSILADDA